MSAVCYMKDLSGKVLSKGIPQQKNEARWMMENVLVIQGSFNYLQFKFVL
jgi:hypothetical protein